MRLVIDTSVLVGALLRTAGRERLADERLDLFLPEDMWGEVSVELPRRIAAFGARRHLPTTTTDELAAACLAAITANVTVIDAAVYSPLESEARARSLRDSRDWPVVATALVLRASIWTHDNDFLGTGVATWTTDSLQAWMERNTTER